MERQPLPEPRPGRLERAAEAVLALIRKIPTFSGEVPYTGGEAFLEDRLEEDQPTFPFVMNQREAFDDPGWSEETAAPNLNEREA